MPLPAPLPHAERHRNDQFPTQNGTTYAYSDALWRNYFVGLAPISSTTPSPQPTQTWTERVAVKQPASFGGKTNLVDFRSAALHEGAHHARVRDTSDTYYAWKTIGGRQALQEEAKSEAQVGTDRGTRFFSASSTLEYTKPYVDVIVPFVRGNTWDESDAYSSKHRLQAGALVTTDDDRWSADGSDLETIKQLSSGSIPGMTEVRTIGSDGTFTDSATISGCRQTDEIGVPVPTTGGAYVIPFHYTHGRCKGVRVPRPFATTFPDWYPGGKLPPSPLYRAAAADRGRVALPPSCHLSSSIASSAERIVRRSTYVSPIGAIVATSELSYYVRGIGLVCNIFQQTEIDYYGNPQKPGTPSSPLKTHVTRSLTSVVKPRLSPDARTPVSLRSASAELSSASASQWADVEMDRENRLVRLLTQLRLRE